MTRPQRVELAEETLAGYTEHLRIAEIDLANRLDVEGPSLWADGTPERAQLVRSGKTIAQLWAGKDPIHVPKGLIHDWIGATCIRAANVENTLALVQSYDRHKEFYRPQVIDSKLVRRCGDVFDIYLRLLKKKIITVVLDTDHHVEYGCTSGKRWWCRSMTTRVAEVESAGKPTESIGQPDTGYGFLWRLFSHWRFEERDGDVWVECRAISLTRDIPSGLGWVLDPMVKKLPRESLIATLEATRRAYGTAMAAPAGMELHPDAETEGTKPT